MVTPGTRYYIAKLSLLKVITTTIKSTKNFSGSPMTFIKGLERFKYILIILEMEATNKYGLQLLSKTLIFKEHISELLRACQMAKGCIINTNLLDEEEIVRSGNVAISKYYRSLRIWDPVNCNKWITVAVSRVYAKCKKRSIIFFTLEQL